MSASHIPKRLVELICAYGDARSKGLSGAVNLALVFTEFDHLATQPQAPQVDGELLDFLEESTATTSHDFVKWIVDVPLKWAGGESEIFSGSTLREAIIAAKAANAIYAAPETPEGKK